MESVPAVERRRHRPGNSDVRRWRDMGCSKGPSTNPISLSAGTEIRLKSAGGRETRSHRLEGPRYRFPLRAITYPISSGPDSGERGFLDWRIVIRLWPCGSCLEFGQVPVLPALICISEINIIGGSHE